MVDISGIMTQSATQSPNPSSLNREVHDYQTTTTTTTTTIPGMGLPHPHPHPHHTLMDDGGASSSSNSNSNSNSSSSMNNATNQSLVHLPVQRSASIPSIAGLSDGGRGGGGGGGGPGPSTGFRRKGVTGALRPIRGGGRHAAEEEADTQRQMQVGNHFPKRAKMQTDVVFVPQQSSIDKFVVSIWEQIHGGINLDPQSLLEQWQLTATATATINNAGKIHVPEQLELGLLHPPSVGPGPGVEGTALLAGEVDVEGTFNRSNIFCRKVTQASRACRSIEVIVQARWIEHFDSYVEVLAVTNAGMSPTKRRKAALIEACNDFGWSEKELRNKMAIWRGYKEIKDAGGWAALVFAGMGLYRFCKYRVGFNPDSMQRLRALRPRIEVAADTLHPTWRQLLMIVGEPSQRRFCGHPHDWVVRHDGADPVPLRSTYLEYDPYFSFEQLEASVMDMSAWGTDDPRWVPPINAVACVQGMHTCHSCGQEQSEDPKINSCYCFPTLFGSGRRSPCPVQVFRTPDGRNNGLTALCPFERGAAIGEFVGLVTKDLRDMDVMDSSTGVRAYQIWQGRQGNFTRFVNHSCKSNAQFQQFVWLGTQRIILVSKGIEAGHEVTVDYSGSYWRGLDKECLCGESCCRYRSHRELR
ncbi:SET domain-containing protein [Colletotrichum trifolii]|uniref:SET domain-containing protein n=1 Tax=Colletotrichum trifolii TaxID=5466 RepID=A0A4R8QQB0_COLTR|nr:SET domain-containing protein [Colletotrichum trifolii]